MPDEPAPAPVLAKAALAVSILSMTVSLWGYGKRPNVEIAPVIGYILVGWAGLLLSLFFAVGAMARRERACATTAFYVTLSLIALMFLFAVGRALALFRT